MYPKPQEPTTCCGRGCENCVWASYWEAIKLWEEQNETSEIN